METIKNLRFAATVAIMVFAFTSCDLDNYSGPDASISGEVRDIDTGDLIEQDVSSGSTIVFTEHGYDNPEEQRMIFKVNGKYVNNLIFSGIYDFYFYESNFVIPEKLTDYQIKSGKNTLDFKVQPYIRITDVSIKKDGDKIVAKFKVTPTVDANVREIGLFGHIDYIVGVQYALDRKVEAVNTSFKGQTREFTLELGDNQFKKGTEYNFRVGAIIDVPNSKYNYAPGVKLTI